MSEIEGSDPSESSDESVRFLGESNPLVEGEVLTRGEARNPIPVDNEEDIYPGFRQAKIDSSYHWMQENTILEAAAGETLAPSTHFEQQTEIVAPHPL